MPNDITIKLTNLDHEQATFLRSMLALFADPERAADCARFQAGERVIHYGANGELKLQRANRAIALDLKLN